MNAADQEKLNSASLEIETGASPDGKTPFQVTFSATC